MPSLPPVTMALLLTNVVAFCLQYVTGDWFDPLALWPIGDGFQPWQLVTYAFLHGGVSHLLFNMLALWMFGSDLERLWGPKRYLQFYFASLLTAALAQLVVANMTGAVYPTVGASGAIYGLLLAFGMMFPNRIIVPLIPPIPMKAKYFVAIFGGLELLFGVSGAMPGIAHFAHLGGMLGGFMMIWYWRGRWPFGR